jgi:hypothetical protein
VNANTGASTLTYNGTTKSIVNQEGSALIPGQIPAGSVNAVVYDGTSFQLFSQGTPQTIVRRKTSNQTVTNSTVFVNDNNLTFPIAANQEVVIAGDLFVTTVDLNTCGIKFQWTGPAGANDVGGLTASGNVGAFPPSLQFTGFGFPITFPAAGWVAGTTTANLHLGMWILNGANSGTVTLQWAQNTASVNTLTLSQGSFFTVTRTQ